MHTCFQPKCSNISAQSNCAEGLQHYNVETINTSNRIQGTAIQSAGVFPGRKLQQNSHFCGDLCKFSPQTPISKQWDTVLVGVVHWVTNPYSQVMGHCASGRGALGY